jgi:hypothetical protein
MICAGMGGTGMNRILTIGFSAAMLAGCAPVYDRTAMPDASMTARQASVSCVTEWAVKEIKTYSELAACNLAAERRYFTAIKLQKMDRFEDYAVRYQALAAMRDTGRISDQQADRRADKMRRDFLAACRCKKERMPGTIGLTVSSVAWLGP